MMVVASIKDNHAELAGWFFFFFGYSHGGRSSMNVYEWTTFGTKCEFSGPIYLAPPCDMKVEQKVFNQI